LWKLVRHASILPIYIECVNGETKAEPMVQRQYQSEPDLLKRHEIAEHTSG
jgi:hypothetical protein